MHGVSPRRYDDPVTPTPWKPSRPVAYLLALLSVWPIVYFFLFVVFMGYVVAVSPKEGFDTFRYVFLLHLATIVLIFALIAVYLVHLFRNDRLAPDRRVLWAVVLLLFGVFAFPVYWWLYVRPGAGDAKPSEAFVA